MAALVNRHKRAICPSARRRTHVEWILAVHSFVQVFRNPSPSSPSSLLRFRLSGPPACCDLHRVVLRASCWSSCRGAFVSASAYNSTLLRFTFPLVPRLHTPCYCTNPTPCYPAPLPLLPHVAARAFLGSFLLFMFS